MATSAIDVRGMFVPSSARAADGSTAPALTARRRPPATVVAAGVIGVLEALGLLAAGLTSLDGLLAAPNRPAGWVVALALGLLAAWIVSCAGSGATLVDGAGRRALVVLSSFEVVVLAGVLTAATFTPVLPATVGDLPLPAAALLVLAVPVGKMLLADTVSARAWVAIGPRVRERRPDPVAAHRLLCTLTVAGIGLGLTALAVLTPTEAGPGADVASVVSDH